MKKGVAVIGYGALGSLLCRIIRERLADDYALTGVFTLPPEPLLKEAGIRDYGSIDALLADPAAEYAVEIAGTGAVRAYGARILQAGKNLIAASVGALADDGLRSDLCAAAARNGVRVFIPSGAIGGFDVFRTLSMMGDASAVIENTKAPESLNGAPYLGGRTLSESGSELVFDGTAREAIAGFPKNVNVAVASALASVGPDRMRTVITSVPGLTENVHRVTVENETVRAVLEVASRPDPANPRSSSMAAWSVAALLQNLASPLQFF